MPRASKTSIPDEPAPGAEFKPVETLTITTPEQLKAISDPLRLSILELIVKEALTVKQIASRLGQPPTKLYYHVSEMEAAGFVTLVETRVKSGIIEKYYRTTSQNITVDRKLLNTASVPEGGLPDLLSVIFDATVEDLTRSVAAGLVQLDANSVEKPQNLILTRCMLHLRKENAGKFIEKIQALLAELDAGEEPAGLETAAYACTIAFYPRVDSPSQEKTEE